MAVNVLHPFDLWQVFVVEIVGNLTLFLILALFMIGVYATRYGVSNTTRISLMVLFVIIVGLYAAQTPLMAFVVLGVGGAFYFAIQKAVNR